MQTTDKFDYFDHAAATPMNNKVLEAMRPYFSGMFYNPSASYAPGRAAADGLRSARASIAHWLGSRPSEVVFTAGGTEANNLAIHGVMRAHPSSSPSSLKGVGASHPANIVVSAVEHDAILRPAGLYDCRRAAVTMQGLVDLESLKSNIDGRTVLVSVMYANNEIGTVQPIREIAAIIADIRESRRQAGNSFPLYLHTDACQAANYLDLHVARLGVDLMTLNGGKIYGPKQSGILYVKAGLTLQPLIFGGGQEQGLRSGTENVAACVGMAAALDAVQIIRHDESCRLREMQTKLIRGAADISSKISVNGSLKKRLPNNVHITVPGQDNERMLLELEAKGILAAAGSACSASSDEPSHVLRAIGLTDEAARSSLRFSMGQPTTAKSVERMLAALASILR